MSLTATTLAAAITEDDKVFNLSATGAAAGHYLRINDEFAYVQAVDGVQVTVQRGRLGTNARAHGILSYVVYGIPADFSVTPAPRIYTYGAAGAMDVAPGLHRLVAASAAAMTLAQPALDQEGMEMTIVAAAAQAYTITTASGKYFNGATNNVATFGGAIGDSLRLVVVGGNWCVVDTSNVTIGT
jgi:hypothetical protein